MNKPYIKNSDLISALACFYKGDDFRPNRAASMQRLREDKIVLGTPETPEFLKEKTTSDGVKVRTRKVSNVTF